MSVGNKRSRWRGCSRRFGCRLALTAITRRSLARHVGKVSAACRGSCRLVRPRRKVTDNGDGLPLHLLAGRCIKVWSPESGDWHEAWRRFGLAGRHWNAEHLGGLLVTFDVPWSYVFVRESRGDDGLTERLARLGLPVGWVPSPAPEDAGRPPRRDAA